MSGFIQRAAPRVLLCGGLGVLTTVSVAWGLAAWVPHKELLRRKNIISQVPEAAAEGVKRPTPVYVSTFEFFRTGMVRRAWKSGVAVRSELAAELGPVSDLALKQPVRQDRSWGKLPRVLASDFAKAGSGGEDARGWPMLAMWCELEEAVTGMTMRGGIAVNAMATPGSARVLPLWPIWKGFAVNSVVFGVAWAVVIPLGLVGRGMWRRRRGRCARCGYERGGNFEGPCPECGLDLQRKVR